MKNLALLDWDRITADLDEDGFALTGPIFSEVECGGLTESYDDDGAFRSRVIMARHGFGLGEYRYFQYPLPPIVAELRQSIYPSLAPLANRWAEAMRQEHRYPADRHTKAGTALGSNARAWCLYGLDDRIDRGSYC